MRSMHSTQLCTHGSQQLCAHGSCRPWCPSDSAQKALSSLPCSPPQKALADIWIIVEDEDLWTGEGDQHGRTSNLTAADKR